MIQHFLTELIVAGTLGIFGLAIRSIVGGLRKTVDDAAARVELAVTKVQQLEVNHGREIAAIDRDITNIYKRLDREAGLNGK